MKVSLLEEQAGPKERALESKWGKILGGGADALPGVHFKRTDELHHEKDVATMKVLLQKPRPKEQTAKNMMSKWNKILGGGADALPGVHYARTDELHHQKDVATMKGSLLEEQAGPKERALESRWGKILGGGADALPGVHFKRTDELHHQRDVADTKVSFLEKAGPKERNLMSRWGKILGGGADALPGVHFKQTDELRHEHDVASAKVFLEEAGPRQRQLESKWGKMLGGGADALPGVHFKQTDELHHERDVASAKVFLEEAGPRQ